MYWKSELQAVPWKGGTGVTVDTTSGSDVPHSFPRSPVGGSVSVADKPRALNATAPERLFLASLQAVLPDRPAACGPEPAPGPPHVPHIGQAIPPTARYH